MDERITKLEKALIEGRIDRDTFDRLCADLRAVSEKKEKATGHSLVADAESAESLESKIEHLSRSLAADPSSAEARHRRGILYRELGNLEQALADQEEAIELDPGLGSAYSEKTILLLSAAKPTEAIDCLSKLIDLEPTNSDAIFGRGEIQQQLGRYQESIADYTESIRLNPQSAVAYCRRADAYLNLSNEHAAFSDYNKALHLDPQNAFAYLRRAETHLKLNRPEKAIVDVNKVLSLLPENAHAHYLLACAYKQMAIRENSERTFSRAVADSRKAHALDSDYDILQDSLAECRRQAGVTTILQDAERFIREKELIPKTGRILKKVAAVAIPVLGVIAAAAMVGMASGLGSEMRRDREATGGSGGGGGSGEGFSGGCSASSSPSPPPQRYKIVRISRLGTCWTVLDNLTLDQAQRYLPETPRDVDDRVEVMPQDWR